MPPPVSTNGMITCVSAKLVRMRHVVAMHCFDTVFDHVVKRLLHLIAIELKQWQIRAQLLFNDYLAILKLRREKRTASSTIVFTFSGRSCGRDGRMAFKNCVTMESSLLTSERATSIDCLSSAFSPSWSFWTLRRSINCK